MNKIYILVFIVLLSCTNSNKVYICGDHPCKNKKEIDDYFQNNILILSLLKNAPLFLILPESNQLQKYKNQDL